MFEDRLNIEEIELAVNIKDRCVLSVENAVSQFVTTEEEANFRHRSKRVVTIPSKATH